MIIVRKTKAVRMPAMRRKVIGADEGDCAGWVSGRSVAEEVPRICPCGFVKGWRGCSGEGDCITAFVTTFVG